MHECNQHTLLRPGGSERREQSHEADGQCRKLHRDRSRSDVAAIAVFFFLFFFFLFLSTLCKNTQLLCCHGSKRNSGKSTHQRLPGSLRLSLRLRLRYSTQDSESFVVDVMDMHINTDGSELCCAGRGIDLLSSIIFSFAKKKKPGSRLDRMETS